MTSYKQRPSLPGYRNRNAGVRLPEVAETPTVLAGRMREAFGDLPLSRDQLREQVIALEARNRDLEDYARTVSHDLKIPLTILIMTADLIKDVPDLTRPESRDCLLQIKSIAREMNNIIDNLLLFAKVSKAEVPREVVQMERVVLNVRNRLSTIIKKQRAQLILPRAWPEAIGYEPWIEEVWANLLCNALKYGKPPRVELGASALPDGMLRFWMRDNGPGIPPEDCTRLFTPFSQISLVTGEGHGLGLSIVLHIVEKLGGQVGVESEVGQGSLFFFTLPVATSYAV